jgi:hypothetical protein
VDEEFTQNFTLMSNLISTTQPYLATKFQEYLKKEEEYLKEQEERNRQK